MELYNYLASSSRRRLLLVLYSSADSFRALGWDGLGWSAAAVD